VTVRIEASVLQDLVRDIFVAAGCSEAEGGRIGQYLVGANLAGHDSHGVARVLRYVQWKREGLILADRDITIVTETPVLAVVDGQYGFGQTVAPQAVALGIAKCKAMGLSAIALRNSGHVGRVGDFAEMAAAEKLVSMHFVTAAGSVLVAPFGGVERRFSTAPCCIGIPRPGIDPLVLDFATSVVAEGKVLVASQGGKKIPEDALIGADGVMGSDPHILYGDYDATGPRDYRAGKGALRAFGDHKGSGLAFMCELLGGALTGTGASQHGRRFANGMFSVYVDPAVMDAEAFFPREVARYVDFVKSSRPVESGGEVLVPGEPEIRMRAERLANGIPLPDDTWGAIMAAAREVGLDPARLHNVTASA
jgi:hydroxycarboxylate dehydrogenase B